MDYAGAMKPIPRQTLQRLPEYLRYLVGEECRSAEYVSSARIARAMGRSEIQVRKDLAAVYDGAGKPRLGFERAKLVGGIESCLGTKSVDSAVLVGVGSLGTALLHYDGFKSCGVELAAAFDRDVSRAGQRINGVYIMAYSELIPMCRRMNVHIGVITVPAAGAQAIADDMIEAGILAIWNFAPVRLEVPDGILVRNENMADSLAMLSHHLAQKLAGERREAN